jgi:hypothetical protein
MHPYNPSPFHRQRRSAASPLASVLLLAGATCGTSGDRTSPGAARDAEVARLEDAAPAGTDGSRLGGSGGPTPGSGGAGGTADAAGQPGSGALDAGGPPAPASADAAAKDAVVDVRAVAGDAAVAPVTPSQGPFKTGPAAALAGFLFDVPCPSAPPANGMCAIKDPAMRAKMATVRFGGDPAKTYKVKLHFCGPIEGTTYVNCTPHPDSAAICVDGKPQGRPTYPAYSMATSSPPHTYFLNNLFKAEDIVKADYSATFEITGGSTITFASDGGSNDNTYTATLKNHNYTCPGVPGIVQPYNGQFIWVTVEGVDPAK